MISELQALIGKKEEQGEPERGWGQRQKGTLKKDEFREAFGLPK